MKPLSNPNIVKNTIIVLGLALGIKLIWTGVSIGVLPISGIDYVKPTEAKALYYRSRFAIKKSEAPKRESVTAIPTADIKSFKLLAIYRSADIIVVTISKSNRSKVLSRNDTIDGYRLEDATATQAIFSKGGKSFKLNLIKLKASKGGDSVKYVKKDQPVKTTKAEPKKEKLISREDGITSVDKSLFDHYRKNMGDIWKNIGISEAKKDGQTLGFRVNFIKRESDFAKLGLRRGDIIESVNGIKLDSMGKAMQVYKEINNIEDISLSIKRGNETMEIEYAVN